MTAIYNAGGPLIGATSHAGGVTQPEVQVPWDEPQAEHVYATLRRNLRNRDEGEAPFFARTAEMAVRLATIRAIGICSHAPRVTVADMEWGHDLAMWSAERMIADARDYMAETPTQAVTLKLYRIIKEAGRISHTALLRKTQTHTARQVKEFLQGLIEGGMVVEDKETPLSGGPKASFYRVA
jgi:hypothetical protein